MTFTPIDYNPYDFANRRHIGPSPEEMALMLQAVGVPSLDVLIDQTVPASIRQANPLTWAPLSEHGLLEKMRGVADKNTVMISLIGQGYFGTVTPPAIQRNILENPAWYTAYTPYQPEIAQGRLEALLNYQTMVADLTGLPVANASLLDEATAGLSDRRPWFDSSTAPQAGLGRFRADRGYRRYTTPGFPGYCAEWRGG